MLLNNSKDDLNASSCWKAVVSIVVPYVVRSEALARPPDHQDLGDDRKSTTKRIES